MADQGVKLKRRTVYSMGEVAVAVRVAARTATKLFDSGSIKGYRIPGSQTRRVTHRELVRFIREHGLDMPVELREDAPVILVGSDSATAGLLQKELSGAAVRLHEAATGFDAGNLAQKHAPVAVLIVDTRMGRQEALAIHAAMARVNPEGKRLTVVQEDEVELEAFGAAEDVFRQPFDVALLAARVAELTRVED